MLRQIRESAQMVVRVLLFSILCILYSSHSLAFSDKNTLHWAGCGITKKAFMSELASAYEAKTQVKIILEGGGATNGIRGVAGLTVDMGGTCRMTLPETDATELHAALHPVAWDALAIISHKSNPVGNLSVDQIRKIYTGKITKWSQVGGPDKPIHLYARKGNISGVGYAIRQYIFQDSHKKFITQYTMNSSGPLEKAIEKDALGLGITGVSSARKRKVKIMAYDGKVPTYENVKQGKYGLYRPLYLVSGPNPSKKVQRFIDFATSDEGRQIIRDNGTVPYKDAYHLMRKMLIYGFGVK